MKGFIKLTYTRGETIRFMVSHIVSYSRLNPDEGHTYVETTISISDDYWKVRETPEEIDKLIEEALK